MLRYARMISHSNRERQFSNFGPCELILRELTAQISGHPIEQIATAANATSALGLAVEVLPGDRVRVPAFSFVGTYLGVRSAKVDVIFDDIRSDSWRLIQSDVLSARDCMESLISVPVLPFGDQPRTNDLVTERCVVDAAASILWLDELPKLGDAQAIIFSTHATKPLGGGEGALAIFGSVAFAEEFRSRTQFGLNVAKRQYSGLGTNAKMSEFNCAAAATALSRFSAAKRDWQLLNDLVSDAFSRYPEVTLRLRRFGFRSPYLILQLDSLEHRMFVQERLSELNIDSKVWYQYLPSIFDTSAVPFTPISQSVAETHLGLPFHRSLRRGMLDRLAQSIAEILNASERYSSNDRA